MTSLSFRRFLLLLGAVAALAEHTTAQTVEKVADLNFVSIDGVGFGGYEPLGRLTQVGTNLWFTTDKGGTFDAGTVSRYDLVTREVVEVASFDNTTGKGSESCLLTIGNEGYFTTKSGGTGGAGTLAKVDYTSGAVTVLYHFPENSASNRTNGLQTGATPRGSLTRIGDELWTTTSLGGTANRGTIVRYHLTTGVASLVANLDGPQLGGQAFAGFTAVGNDAWYFTTFSGGSTFATTTGSYALTLPNGSTLQITNSLPLGAGTLGRLTFDEFGQPLVSRVVDLTNGYPQFPGTEPTLVGTNSLYFGTTGPNNAPGAIIRYDLDTGTWTNLFSFSTNGANALAYGTRPGYSAFVEWLGELYFLTRQGGVSNLGVVAKFNLASNTVTKLADFEGTAGAALGRATGIFDNSGLLVEENGRFHIYYTVTSGGVNNRGTILRVNLPAPPIHLALAPAAPGELALTWTGGYAPFTVQARQSLTSGDWDNLIGNVAQRAATISMTNRHAFFRVIGAP
jgi:uncharacterized repeat protein (TIGR03803 family)